MLKSTLLALTSTIAEKGRPCHIGGSTPVAVVLRVASRLASVAASTGITYGGTTHAMPPASSAAAALFV